MEKVKIYRSMVSLPHADLFVRDTRTDGPAILCLHGRWGRGETWVDFIRHYGNRYRIIAPDQRGHGLSDKPASGYTAEEMAADMVELIGALHLDRAVWVGHSMGGRVAGYGAALHPECVKAAAILDKSAAGPTRTEEVSGDQALPVDPVTGDWPAPFQSLREAEEYIHSVMETELSYRYFMDSLVETVEGYRMMFSSQAMAANIAHETGWFHLLPKIVCPVLLIRALGGEAVPDEDFRKMQSLISDCRAYEVSDPDHNVHLSRKAEFYTYLDEFLSGV